MPRGLGSRESVCVCVGGGGGEGGITCLILTFCLFYCQESAAKNDTKVMLAMIEHKT